MPTLDATQLEHLARLARLSLPADQRDVVVREMARIVQYVDVLRAVPDDVRTTTTTTTSTADGQLLAPDDIGTSDPNKRHLSGAACVRDGYLVVPLVLDRQDDGHRSP